MNPIPNGLVCPSCDQLFQNPRTLDCLHSYCLECLEKLVKKDGENEEKEEKEEDKNILNCPLCQTSLEIEDFSSLPIDHFLLNELERFNLLSKSLIKEKIFCVVEKEEEALWFCEECQEYLCERCKQAHQGLKLTKNHPLTSIEQIQSGNLIEIVSGRSSHSCLTHQKEIELYCRVCELPICAMCPDDHKDHSICNLSNVVEQEKQKLEESLTNLLTLVKPKLGELSEGVERCENISKELDINLERIQNQITHAFDEIRIKLNEREKQLKNESEKVVAIKKEKLANQKENLQFGSESLKKPLDIIESSLSKLNNDVPLLSMKKQYLSRLNFLAENQWKTQPVQDAFLDFSISSDDESSIDSIISKIGTVTATDISEKESFLSFEMTKVFEDEEFLFKAIVHNKESKIVGEGNQERFKIIVDEGKENTYKTIISDEINGEYLISIKFQETGKYKVHVQYDEVTISPSPLQVQVYPKPRDYSQFLEPKIVFNSSKNGKLQFPAWICSNTNGNIIISDSDAHQIQIFNNQGNLLSTLGSKGSQNGQFFEPSGIAVNKEGNIFVCDLENHRVQIFNEDGTFISTFGSFGNGDGEFDSPKGIAIDNNGNILVCDEGNHRVQIFEPNGTFIAEFGEKGKGNGQFLGINAIKVNSKGEIIISDFEAHRIQKFDSSGNYLSNFGSKGTMDGQFDWPCGIDIDLQDNILIVDSSNNRIQIFDSNGNFISKFGMNLNHPRGIAFDLTSNSVIVSEEKGKVLIF